MEDINPNMFRLLTVQSALAMSLASALRRLSAAYGANAPQKMAELRRKMLRDVKNAAPRFPVKDDVMQKAIAASVTAVDRVFDIALKGE